MSERGQDEQLREPNTMGIVLDEHLEANCITPRRSGYVTMPHVHAGMHVLYHTKNTHGDTDTKQQGGLVSRVVYNPRTKGRWEVEVSGAKSIIPVIWCQAGYVEQESVVRPEQNFQILVPREYGPIEWLTALVQRRLRPEFSLEGINARVITTSTTGEDATVYLSAVDGRGVFAIPATQLLSYSRTTRAQPRRVAVRDAAPEPQRSGRPTDSPANPQTTYQSPEDIAVQLREIVHGQEPLIETLAVAAYDHLVRPDRIKKGNVLVVGPTGTGKTESARSVSTLLGLPFAEAKLSGKSTTGFKGDNLATIFSDLQGSRDHPFLGRAVLFLDETDKVVDRVSEGNGFGSGLQNELIGWVESATVKVPNGNTEFVVDTTDMLFVAAGAFVDLEEIIAKRVGTDLSRYQNGDRQKAVTALYPQMMPDDLIAFGLKPELVGRFPYLTYAKPLDREMLVRILKNGKKSVFGQQVRLLQEGYGIAIEVDEEVYDAIADFAQQLGTGARGLETATMKLFKQIKLRGRRGTNVHITQEHAQATLKDLPSRG